MEIDQEKLQKALNEGWTIWVCIVMNQSILLPPGETRKWPWHKHFLVPSMDDLDWNGYQ